MPESDVTAGGDEEVEVELVDEVGEEAEEAPYAGDGISEVLSQLHIDINLAGAFLLRALHLQSTQLSKPP